jgi:hypothetical protein
MLDRYTALAPLMATVVAVLVDLISQRMRAPPAHLATPATKIGIQQTPSTSAAPREPQVRKVCSFIRHIGVRPFLQPEPLLNIRVPA